MIGRRRLGVLAAPAFALPGLRSARAASRRLRLGLGVGLDTSYGAAARVVADHVAEATGGRLSIDLYPDATLGNNEAILVAIRAGTLDLATIASGLLAEYVPEIGLLDLPFLFRDAAQARAALDGPEGAALAAAATAAGIAVLAWGENGLRHLTSNRPLSEASDLRGLRLRVLRTPLLINAFHALGATAETWPFSQLYEALRTGQFEAEENPVQLILAAKFYEVQSHLTLTGHAYSAGAIIASADLLEDLDAKDRAVLVTACRAGALKSRAFVESTEGAGVSALRNQGMTIVDNIDRNSFLLAVAPAEAEAAQRFGADRIERLRRAA